MSSGTPERHPVIINTGPLLALAMIDQLDLLRTLYSQVFVPEAVAREARQRGPQAPGTAAVVQADWITRRATQSPPHPLVVATLDEGEAEVVTLAQELGIRHVLIDETAGRRVARLLGLDVSGSVGVVLRAKRSGHIASVRPLLEGMRECGIWLGRGVVEFALREAGE